MSNIYPRPRIGIDVTAAVTQGGGIGRYTRELVKALIREDDHSCYRLFSAKSPKKPVLEEPFPQSSNVEYREFWLSDKWLNRLWYRLKVPLSIQRLTGQLDLFHSPDFVLPPSGDIPTVLTIHDLSFIHFPEAFTPALLDFLNSAVPTSISRASHLLADSEATKSDLIDIWQVPIDKISVIYSGISANFKPITDKKAVRDLRAKYQLGDNPYILSVGTLQPRKNYEMLINAFKPVADATDYNLVISGGFGWLYEQIAEEISKLGMTKKVKLIGFVDDQDLPGLYSEASLFVFPSLYEGFGIPLLEAMSCGVPIVSSNTSSLPEVAGDAARLLPPNDQDLWSATMIALLNDSSQRTKMVAAGFLQARKFSWQKAAEDVLDIYKKLLEG